jgi:hypothetical protein
MAKAPEKKTALVDVVLTFVYSGFNGDPGPGDTVSVDADEAARLIALGAKKAD